MEEVKLRTLSVLVDNEAGVLSQVSRLFSRKGFNVESLAVGATDNPAISRRTRPTLCATSWPRWSPSTRSSCSTLTIPSAAS